MIPIWLLDVDGVLNAVRGSNSLRDKNLPEDSWVDWQYEVVIGYPILIATGLIEFVNSVHRNGLAEVRWLTTWKEQAQTELAPAFGFDHFEVQPTEPQKFSDTSSWWKVTGAELALSEGRKVVWTDDDMWELRYTNLNDDPDLFTIMPDTDSGLTPDDCFAIMTFLEGHKYGEENNI